jgi:hypothetical protein
MGNENHLSAVPHDSDVIDEQINIAKQRMSLEMSECPIPGNPTGTNVEVSPNLGIFQMNSQFR